MSGAMKPAVFLQNAFNTKQTALLDKNQALHAEQLGAHSTGRLHSPEMELVGGMIGHSTHPPVGCWCAGQRLGEMLWQG